MDGVICDFESRFKSLQQLNPKEFIQKEGNDKFWEVIDEEGNLTTRAVEAKDAYTYMDTKDEATTGYTEKTRLGVRYSELLAFIISAI